MAATATKQTKEVTSRAIDVLDPRQVEVELAITAHRIGREPGLLHLGDPRPGEIALELQADSVDVWLYGDPQHDPSGAQKTANARPRARAVVVDSEGLAPSERAARHHGAAFYLRQGVGANRLPLPTYWHRGSPTLPPSPNCGSKNAAGCD